MSATSSPASSTARRLASVARARTERPADRVNAVQPIPVIAVRPLIACISRRLLARVDAATLVGAEFLHGRQNEGLVDHIGRGNDLHTRKIGTAVDEVHGFLEVVLIQA